MSSWLNGRVWATARAVLEQKDVESAFLAAQQVLRAQGRGLQVQLTIPKSIPSTLLRVGRSYTAKEDGVRVVVYALPQGGGGILRKVSLDHAVLLLSAVVIANLAPDDDDAKKIIARTRAITALPYAGEGIVEKSLIVSAVTSGAVTAQELGCTVETINGYRHECLVAEATRLVTSLRRRFGSAEEAAASASRLQELVDSGVTLEELKVTIDEYLDLIITE